MRTHTHPRGMGTIATMHKPLILALLALSTTSALAQQTAPPATPAPSPAPAPLDEKLADLVADMTITTVATGIKFAEGPLWYGDALLVCDLAGDTIYRIVPGAEPVAIEKAEHFRDASGSAAGITLDAQGRIVCAQFDGKLTRSKDANPKPGAPFEVLVEKIGEAKLGRANDVVVHPDGSIFFTDFGNGNLVRLSAAGEASIVAKGLSAPNGLTFSLDHSRLFVAEYGAQNIKVVDIASDGTVSEAKDFASTKAEGRGTPDGMKTDEKGNIYSTGPGGIWVFTPAGEKLGVIKAPGTSNFCFGGPDGRTLFMTAGKSVKSLKMKVAGAPAIKK